MAVNPYFTSSAQQYTPEPIEALWKMGAIGEARRERDYEDEYKLNSLLGSVKAIDEHRQFKKDLDARWYERLSGIHNKIQAGDKSVRYDLMKANIDWAKDPVRQELEESYKQYEDDTKKKVALGAKYGPWGDDNIGFQGATPTGEINPYRSKPIRERQDHHAFAKSMLADVKPSGEAAQWFNLDPNTGNIISAKKGYEGVASDWIKKLSKLKSNDFLSTTQGQDWMAENQYYNGALGTPEDYIYRTNADRIFGTSTDGEEMNLGPEWMNKKKTGDEYNYLNSKLLPQNNRFALQQTYDVSTGLSKKEIDDVYKRHGLLDRNGKLKNYSGRNWEAAQAEIASAKTRVKDKPFDENQLPPDQKDVFSRATKQFGRVVTTLDGANKLLNDYLDWHNSKVARYTIKDYDGTVQKTESDTYFGDKQQGGVAINRNFKPMNGDFDAREYTGQDFYKDYGNPKEYNKTIVGELGDDNPFYPGAKICKYN